MATPQQIRPHIFLPLPSLKNAPDPPASREEKLEEIISNIEKQQQQVRNNIIAAAKARLASTTALDHHDDDGTVPMDLNSPSQGEIDVQQDLNTSDLFMDNLSAQYVEGSGDPCVKSRSDRASLHSEVRQITPPPQISLAKVSLDQIDLYDQHASKARDYYVRALERRRSSAGINTYPSNGTTTNAPANASPIDLSRDPRRRPR